MQKRFFSLWKESFHPAEILRGLRRPSPESPAIPGPVPQPGKPSSGPQFLSRSEGRARARPERRPDRSPFPHCIHCKAPEVDPILGSLPGMHLVETSENLNVPDEATARPFDGARSPENEPGSPCDTAPARLRSSSRGTFSSGGYGRSRPAGPGQPLAVILRRPERMDLTLRGRNRTGSGGDPPGKRGAPDRRGNKTDPPAGPPRAAGTGGRPAARSLSTFTRRRAGAA